MKKEQRFVYIDFIKTIAVFFVCTYHFWRGDNIFFDYDMEEQALLHKFLSCIVGSGVPLFFAANGAMLLNKTFDAKHHYATVLRTLLQFFIWRTVTALILGCVCGFPFELFSLQQWINHFIFLLPIDGIDLSYLWFIPMLCCIYLLYPFYKMMFDRAESDRSCWVVFAVFLIFLYVSNFVVKDCFFLKFLSPFTSLLDTSYIDKFNPFNLLTGAMSLYFLLGGFIHKYRRRLASAPAFLWIGAILLGMLGLFGAWYMSSYREGFNYDIVFGGYDTTWTLLCTVGIIMLTIKLDSFLSKYTWIASALHCIGRNTIYVYYVHWLAGFMLLPHMPFGYGFWENGLKTVILVTMGVLTGEIIKKNPIIRKCL